MLAHEKLLIAFFGALAFFSLFRGIPMERRALLFVIPWLLYWAGTREWRVSHRWSGVAREWMAPALILPAYWSIECFATATASPWQGTWIAWDRFLLHEAGLKVAVEGWGAVIPAFLELTYLLLYAFPPMALAVLYLAGERSKVPRFLTILFLGTLTSYMLLTMLPVESPRIAFPGADLPGFSGFPRSLNVWLLDHLDISTSVFPSGHVAVAFSCAFGLFAAVPGRRAIWTTAFALAFAVYVATVYGRYHYAVDGFASLGIAVVAWRVGARTSRLI
jgi:membrane-associated phospholipid phosphatase